MSRISNVRVIEQSITNRNIQKKYVKGIYRRKHYQSYSFIRISSRAHSNLLSLIEILIQISTYALSSFSTSKKYSGEKKYSMLLRCRVHFVLSGFIQKSQAD